MATAKQENSFNFDSRRDVVAVSKTLMGFLRLNARQLDRSAENDVFCYG
jgi:hypothetical protein